ncbi:hypothetical protein [Winogradskyella ouciana]|uniref:Uncharacterized protein n=1 Tax=Winogradskyella ouciana TaxID=2608631 RepID=A0A7K1GE10_9FLAO|nr:hypothetical protein [Winogradskyella ouciana]MTE27542.1 hypothetical protein [Winogradskyella ouciana]
MKTLNIFVGSILFLLLICPINLTSQENHDPTLSVGLESLTFGKGTIDVKALEKIIVRKQNELKREGLKRYVFDQLPPNNYTLKLFVQNAIITIVDEQNQNIVEKELLELATNYALVVGFSKILYELNIRTEKKGKTDKSSDGAKPEPSMYELFKVILDSAAKNGEVYTLNSAEKSQLFIDIIGTALSGNQKLKKRGFFDFDSAINYENSQLYKRYFAHKNLDVDFANIIEAINKTIDELLLSYRYINDILENKVYKSLDELKRDYLKSINEELYSSNTLFKNYMAKHNLEKLLALLQVEDILVNDKLTSIIEAIPIKASKFDNVDKNFYKTSINAIENEVVSINPPDSLEIRNYFNNTKLRWQIRQNKKNLEKLLTDLESYNKALKKYDSTFIVYKNSWIQLGEQMPNLDKLFEAKTEIELYTTTVEGLYNKYSNDSSLNKNRFTKLRDEGYTLEDLKNYFNYNTNVVNAIVDIQNSITSTKDVKFLDMIDISEHDSIFKIVEGNIKVDKNRNTRIVQILLKEVSNDLLEKNLKKIDDVFLYENADFLSNLYHNIQKLSKKEVLTIDDILYLENEVLERLVKAKIYITDSVDDRVLNNIITNIRAAIPVLKYLRRPDNVMDIINVLNHEKIGETSNIARAFLEFISNINKLDQSETFAEVLQLLDITHNYILSSMSRYKCYSGSELDNRKNIIRDSLKNINQPQWKDLTKREQKRKINAVLDEDGKYCKFKNIYEKLINSLEKYTIINKKDNIIEIDLLSLLNTFIDRYNNAQESGKNELYFTLGISQNVLLSEYKSDASDKSLTSVGFASEKLGYKFKLKTYTDRVPKNFATSSINSYDKEHRVNPFVNQIYGLVYGSGLLYNIANLTTDDNFNYPHIGFGIGMRFYNALDVNFIAGLPFIEDEPIGEHIFLGLGFDIPIGEYLKAIRGN